MHSSGEPLWCASRLCISALPSWPGFWSDNMDIGVGDAFDCEDEEDVPEDKGKKNKQSGLPLLEGPESVDQFIGKFKRACLAKRQALNEVKCRLESESCQSHQKLDCPKSAPRNVYTCTL